MISLTNPIGFCLKSTCAACAKPRINFLICFCEIFGFFPCDFLGAPAWRRRGRSRARRGHAEHRGAKEWYSKGGSGSAVIVIALVVLVAVVVIVIIVVMIKALHHDRTNTSEAKPKR